MSGQVTGKGYSSYQVNEALLASVVEAIKVGEADARRYGQIRSFEIHYDGFRERLVLGRILIVPAKLADTPEDFPSALLYGAMVREMRPEDIADLYSFKLGESEFDQYDKKGLAEIKDRLFRDADGVYRSVILFIPTWANVRDYVTFKMTRDFDLLRTMVRHLVFAAYFDPKYSTAFDYLESNTESLHVSEINPKINYPGISQAGEKSFPEFKPGDGGIKVAGKQKRIVLLAADTVDSISDNFLEAGEKAVLDHLNENLVQRVSGDIVEPAEVSKEAATDATDAKDAKDAKGAAGAAGTKDDVVGPTCKGCGSPIRSGKGKWCAGVYCTKYVSGLHQVASTDDKGAETGLRSQPDYGESDSHTAEANAAAEAEPKSAGKTASPLGPARGALHELQQANMLLVQVRTGAYEVLGKEGRALMEAYQMLATVLKSGQLPEGQVKDLVCTATDRVKASTIVKNDTGDYSKDQDLSRAFMALHQAIEHLRSGKRAGAARVVAIEGGELLQKGSKFVAKSASGHAETLRINGKRIKWVRPMQFTSAFRRAAETYVRNPTHAKKADVPLTFETIWDDIAEPMGPAPAIEINAPKPDGTGGEAAADAKPKARLDKLETDRGKTMPKADVSPDAAKGFLDSVRKSDADEKPKEAKIAHAGSLGVCKLCHQKVASAQGSEVAPGTVVHASCYARAKRAAFDMFIPGQVLEEFYPELQQETVEYPTSGDATSDGFDPAIGLPGLSPTGVQQSADGIPGNGEKYIPTSPAAAMGIGNNGKSQVLEGAPLRQDNDIRGYAFDQEYYATQQNLSPKAFVAAMSVQTINKKASTEEFQAQFADFLKKAMGEIAATFITAFKVTARPLMNKVPGTGEVQLEQIEQNNMPMPLGSTNVASRVRYLMGKLTDSQIQEAINNAWAQCTVWNGDPNGGYNYEVFVRPDSLDKTTAVLRYEFVVGTKGL